MEPRTSHEANQQDYQKSTKIRVIQSPLDLSTRDPLLLDDETLAKFLIEGYLVLKPSESELSSSFHQEIALKTKELKFSTKDNNPGNNILPSLPELSRVFETPTVRGALQSVLGENYLMHSHRWGHINPPGFEDQKFHKDSFFGYRGPRNHRPIWVMLMYYPSAVTYELGPTCIVPASQYLANKTPAHVKDLPSSWGVSPRMMTCEGGSLVMIHYDLWHRGTGNKGTEDRLMFKFQFLRTQIPTEPSWNNQSVEFPDTEAIKETKAKYFDLSPVWIQIWNWLRGNPLSKLEGPKFDLNKLESNLFAANKGDEHDAVSLRAATVLSSMGTKQSVEVLKRGILKGSENVARNAMLGLSIAPVNREETVKLAIEALNNATEEVARIQACFVLGNINFSSDPIVDTLLSSFDHRLVGARRTAVEAVGKLVGLNQKQLQRIMDSLCTAMETSKDDQVIWGAAFSLGEIAGRCVEAGVSVDRATKVLVALHQQSPNRYVRFFVLWALQQIPTMEAKDSLLKILWNSRWCELTTASAGF